jgi:hypothetical protein
MERTENTLSDTLKINRILDIILVLFVPILTTIGILILILTEVEVLGFIIMGVICLTLLGVALVWFKLLYKQITGKSSNYKIGK